MAAFFAAFFPTAFVGLPGFGCHSGKVRGFKAYISGDAVWIRMMKARSGTQETIHSVRARLEILDDAMAMEREQFRLRLEKFLRQNGFEI